MCEAGATAQSVTKQVKFLQGRINVSTTDQGQTVKKLNVIDTIGKYLPTNVLTRRYLLPTYVLWHGKSSSECYLTKTLSVCK